MKKNINSTKIQQMIAALKGDLVKFSSTFGFQAAYAPSGIIVGIEKRDIMGFAERVSYKVLWADGKHTREWDCYLEKLV